MNSTSKSIWVWAFILCIALPVQLFAERTPGKVALRVNEMQQRGISFRTYQPVKRSAKLYNDQVAKTVTRYTMIDIAGNELNRILNEQPEFLSVTIPMNSVDRELLLYKVDISPNGFTLETSDGRKNPLLNTVQHYRGMIKGDLNSIVSFSFSQEETMGIISNDEGDFVLGKIDDPQSDEYVLYNDKDLIPSLNSSCGTDTDNMVQPYATGNAGIQNPAVQSTNCVNWYYEIDYDIYVGKGSLANVNSYIQGVFNQVAALYDNDGVSVTLQTLFVWTSTDPYTGPTTSNFLNQFGAYRTSFTGDLANLIGYAGSGGIAYVNGLCSSTQFRMGYTGISSSYNTVPTYSWTVEVITHEDGHLLGSRHTHDCVWNGNNTRIDGCGPQAGYPGNGSCASASLPASGTIMSYCHLVGGVGINFNNGFGPQPSALILNNVNNSSCLSACSSCPTPPQPGNISGATTYCQTTSQTYSVTAVAGATSYTWTLPNGWTGSSTTNSITVTTSGSGGTISVVANNSCGDSPARTLTVSGNTAPAQPGNLLGGTSVCAGTGQTYSVQPVSGATSYTWSLPNGWTGNSTTNNIVVTVGASSGNVSVTAVNGCGSSAPRTISVTAASAPAQPLAVSGETSVCEGSAYVYSVPVVSGATSYTWTLPNGWTGNSTSNIITAICGLNAGDISVTATNGCGTSAASTITTSIPVAPGKPAGINAIGGNVKVCPGDVIDYSIPAVANSTSYTWTPPAGSIIINGQGTTTVTVSYNSGFTAHDTIFVVANNGCAKSPERFKKIFRNTPGKPSLIVGTPAGNCNLTGVPYSVNSIPGMTYNWVMSQPGATIASGHGTGAITIDFGPQFVSSPLTVTASNACGTSNARSVTLFAKPAQPYLITGTTSPCANQQGVPYSIDPVAGAISYTWKVPTGARIDDGVVTSTSAILNTTANAVTVNYKTTDGLVKVRANNACGSSAYRKMNVTFACRTEGIAANLQEVDVYPNPASDNFHVMFESNAETTYTIRLTDLTGKQLQITNGIAGEGTNDIPFIVSEYSPGIYFIETVIGDQKTVRKFVIN